MRTFIIGTGGTGGYFGGVLARSGVDVTFLARGQNYTALAESGLFVKSPHGDFHLSNIKVIDSIAKVENPELVLIFVKTYSTAEIEKELAKVVTPNTIIVTFQTGFENDLELKRTVNCQQIFPGIIHTNTYLKSPGQIVLSSKLARLVYGARNGATSAELLRVDDLLKGAGIEAILSKNIELDIWTKLVWMSAYAGAQVLFRSTIGNILNNTLAEKIFQDILAEATATAQAQGISLPEESQKEIASKLRFFKKDGKDAKASMLIDIECGKRTEIETMHGALLRYAQQANLKTPLLELIYSVVKVYEAGIFPENC